MTTLRDDYDPNSVPVNSSAIHRIDTSLFELSLEEEVLESEVAAANTGSLPRLERPLPYRVSLSVRAQRRMNRLVYRVSRSPALKTAWVVLVIVCGAASYFTLTDRLDHIDDNLVLLEQLGQLDTRLLTVERQWSSTDMRALQSSVQNADNRRVFLDYQSLAVWLGEKAQFARELDLEFTYQLGESEPSEIDGMFEAPVTVRIESNARVGNVFISTLEFLKRVVSTPYYVEISEASLEGEGQGARRMTATLRVWVHSAVRAASDVQ